MLKITIEKINIYATIRLGARFSLLNLTKTQLVSFFNLKKRKSPASQQELIGS
jgi:hypothetical protein